MALGAHLGAYFYITKQIPLKINDFIKVFESDPGTIRFSSLFLAFPPSPLYPFYPSPPFAFPRPLSASAWLRATQLFPPIRTPLLPAPAVSLSAVDGPFTHVPALPCRALAFAMQALTAGAPAD